MKVTEEDRGYHSRFETHYRNSGGGARVAEGKEREVKVQEGDGETEDRSPLRPIKGEETNRI